MEIIALFASALVAGVAAVSIRMDRRGRLEQLARELGAEVLQHDQLVVTVKGVRCTMYWDRSSMLHVDAALPPGYPFVLVSTGVDTVGAPAEVVRRTMSDDVYTGMVDLGSHGKLVRIVALSGTICIECRIRDHDRYGVVRARTALNVIADVVVGVREHTITLHNETPSDSGGHPMRPFADDSERRANSAAREAEVTALSRELVKKINFDWNKIWKKQLTAGDP